MSRTFRKIKPRLLLLEDGIHKSFTKYLNKCRRGNAPQSYLKDDSGWPEIIAGLNARRWAKRHWAKRHRIHAKRDINSEL